MYIFVFIAIAIFTISVISKSSPSKGVRYVQKYKIVKKYDTGLMWAAKLYFTNGEEGWNETIPGSFCARDYRNGDLTFVHSTEEDSRRHTSSTFPNAEEVFD